MSKSPITVQQWLESLPSTHHSSSPNIFSTSTMRSTPTRRFLPRELSLQSDEASSHCSSVESVLESRKPDPEAVLLGLGFGPPKGSNLVQRIPARFLQPSQLIKNIDINKFIEQYSDPKYSEQSAPSSPAKNRPKTY